MTRNLIAEALNEAATFQPGDRAAYPAIVVGGVRVLAWIDDNGIFRIHAETGGGFADPSLMTHEDGTVAIAVKVDDVMVFAR